MIKREILVFTQYFLPGFKAGGPIRSMANLLAATSDQNHYFVVTGDRDIKDPVCYGGIEFNQWLTKDNYKIYYLRRSIKGFKVVYFGIQNFDQIYLNSFFSPFFGILPCLFGLAFKKKVIIAPRGEFSTGALTIKSGKKKFFLHLFKAIKGQKKVLWQATSPQEENDIRLVMGNKVKIVIAPNLSAPDNEIKSLNAINKNKPPIADKLLLLFVGRIAEIKNLDFALSLLKKATFPVEFSIFGPLEDQEYLKKCKKIIQDLPSHVHVTFNGEVPHYRTKELFQKHHFLLFPSKGENYSHVIAESLQNGCPVILSDQHPWNELEKHQAGWSIPLDSPEKFVAVLGRVSSLTQEEYNRLSENTLNYWDKKYKQDLNTAKSLYKKLFDEYV